MAESESSSSNRTNSGSDVKKETGVPQPLYTIGSRKHMDYPEHPVNIAVFGSSDIKYLTRYLQVHCVANLGLDYRLCMVQCWGHEGLLVVDDCQNRLELSLSTHRFRNKDLIYLHMGGDDIANCTAPLKVVSELIAFSDKLLKTFHPKCIIISPALCRCPEPYEGFNDNIKAMNQELFDLCKNKTGVRVWKHRSGLCNPGRPLYSADDRHLTDNGAKSFMRSVRDALLRHIRWHCIT